MIPATQAKEMSELKISDKLKIFFAITPTDVAIFCLNSPFVSFIRKSAITIFYK